MTEEIIKSFEILDKNCDARPCQQIIEEVIRYH